MDLNANMNVEIAVMGSAMMASMAMDSAFAQKDSAGIARNVFQAVTGPIVCKNVNASLNGEYAMTVWMALVDAPVSTIMLLEINAIGAT